MNKLLILGARMRNKADKVVELEESIKELNKRSELEAKKLEQAGTDEEVSAVEKNLEDIQKESDEKEAEKEQLEKEIEDLKNQVEELNRKAPTYPSQEKRGGQKLEQREAFNHYLRTKEARADGFKSAEGEAIIPVELMTPKEAKQDKTDLTSLVNIVNVKNASGKWSVVKLTDQEMNTVEELEENPELAKPTFTKVNYEIQTRRGHLPVSQEFIDDADYDVMGLVAKQTKNQERITKNKEIAKVLKTATSKSAAGLDGLKDILNVELKTYYNATIVCTQSMFAALDKIKDKDGRYMLQTDITSPTGYKFAGRVIVVYPDDIIGESKGDLKAFIGDVGEFATLFDRAQTTVKWQDDKIYGQYLATANRFDVVKVDGDAGFYVTYTDAVL
ncbi:Capsid protein [Streptococcus pneumoniae]|nr:phage major capsid protein [Streptococcus pneumoniae]VJP05585.1 Capsid protein [Streptococcus pneumoniae]VMK07778.1 Capsid protein [Streptococcus pneumoniae]VOL62386.1 Capsid protein [Streptococcus pneumoniae]VQC72897.1 Capsid protein [Streptococcus pneumoniae]